MMNKIVPIVLAGLIVSLAFASAGALNSLIVVNEQSTPTQSGGESKVSMKSSQGKGCVTDWVWNGREYVKADWEHPMKKLYPEHKYWKQYKKVDAKYCWANPKLKPTSPPSNLFQSNLDGSSG